MTARERVLAAIRHQQPDRTPMDFGGSLLAGCKPEFLVQLREVLGLTLPADRDADGTWVDEQILQYLGTDLRWVPDTPPLVQLREIDPAAHARILAEREQPPTPAEGPSRLPLADLTLDDVKQMRPQTIAPPPYLDWMIETAKSFRAAGYATTCWLDCGFFEMACWQRGYEEVAMDLLAEPELLQGLFDIWLQEKLQRIEVIAKPLAPYIDIFCHGDDLALQTGPFMAPELFRSLIKPYYVEQYGALHRAAPDSSIYHHSCGSVYSLIEDFIDMGVDILNPIQPNAADMEIEKLKAVGCGRLCYHGGIDLQHLLPFGTPEEVAAETRRRIDVLGAGGGYICAAAHALPDDVPVENILAMFAGAREAGAVR